MGAKNIIKNICGLDPGLYRTGYGIVRPDDAGSVKIVDAGVIETDKSASLPDRLNQIYDELIGLFSERKIDYLAVESLYSHYKHPRTAILMGHARGVILLSTRKYNIPIVNLSATQIKKSLTGNGRASKLQIQRAVISRLGLHQVNREIPSDVTDALAIAICCYEHQKGNYMSL